MRIPFTNLSITRQAPAIRPGGAFAQRSALAAVAAATGQKPSLDLATGLTRSAPQLPPRRADGGLTEVMPPFGTNPPGGPVSGMGSDLSERSVYNDPRELWYLALPNKLSPKQVLQILRSALGGDVWQQWQLCSLMLDSWPMFRKCAHELRQAASSARYVVRAHCEDGDEPDDDAERRASTVRRAMANFRPNPFTDEKGWSDFCYDCTDAMLNGLGMVELLWHDVTTKDGFERLPRAGAWVHPRHFTFTNDGTVAVFDDDYRRLYFNLAGPVGMTPDLRKFICCQFMSRSGSSLGAGMMRPLAWYWAAVMFNREWMMKAAQNYGAPFLDVTYKPNTHPDDLAKLDAEIKQGLANRFVRHKEGTTLTIEPAQSLGADNPQRFMAEMADKACLELMLGQEGTTKTQPGQLGGKDESKEKVKREYVQALAQWLGNGPLSQFARAVLIVNYGDDEQLPTIAPDFTEATDPMAQAQRDETFLTAKVPMIAEEFYKENNLTMPQEGDLVIVGGQLGYLAAPQDDIGGPPPPPAVGGFDQEGNPVPGAQPSVDSPRGADDDGAGVSARLVVSRRLLGTMTSGELAEVEPLVAACERAKHRNGEDKALRAKLAEIAGRKRTT